MRQTYTFSLEPTTVGLLRSLSESRKLPLSRTVERCIHYAASRPSVTNRALGAAIEDSKI